MLSYISLIKPKYLTEEFLAQYKTKKAPFGQLGLIVYLRTYSRFIPELNRREHWWETVLRVVEYSMSLVPKRPRVPFAEEDLRKEAESLFDMIFNMRGFPAGRTLFVGGSKAAAANPTSNFNCSYLNVENLKSFTDAMYLLLLGCGVGYSIEDQYVSQLPKFNTQVELDLEVPVFHLWKEDDHSHDETVVDYNEHGDIFITVGDSKQSWCNALKYFLEYFTDFDPAKGKSIIINYDYIRPEGARLKTFGGRASGFQALKNMFEEIAARIKATDGTIDPTTAMDIMNSIAKAIVVGGTRRSSQIAFGDAWDGKFRDAKKDLWVDPEKEQYRTTRVLSNNSVHLWKKPSFVELQQIFETIKSNGEPGLSIAQNAAKRRPNYRGSNPLMVAA